tara:strand:+ start:950 stop:1561 length:612 start_codon:yes stop_codon:yes gene_type:complete
MKSLSEIDIVSKRASRAAGFPWGIAEEVGKNIRILESFGLLGIKSLNYYYKKRQTEKFENLSLITENNKLISSSYCPIVCGTSFLDQIKSLENLNEISFEKIAYPILFLAFVSRASEIIGKRIFIEVDEYKFLLNLNNSIYASIINNEVIKLASNIKIKFIENSDSFLESEWQELYKLSENIFVDETDDLKSKAAGAGLTDND